MKYRHHLSRQILTGCLAFALILGLLAAAISAFTLRDGMIEQSRTRIRDVINLTLARIDVADLEACMASGAPSEALTALEAFMDRARQSCALDYLVICRPVREGDSYDVKAVASGLPPEERAGEGMDTPGLGDSVGAAVPADAIPVLYDDMLNRRDIRFSGACDGSLAIRNANGDGVALLAAGLSAQAVTAAALRRAVLILAGVAVAAAAFLALMKLWLDRRVVRPIRMIEQAAAEFTEKSHIQVSPEALIISRPDIHTGDELESLSDAVVALSESMRTYAENMIHSAARMQDMKQEVDKANEIALKDALTDVRNKAAFDQALSALNQEIERGDGQFGLAMIDLNYLKRINDAYGHEKGDLYLKNTSALICNTFSHSPVFRVGGDEFVVLLKNVDLASRDVLFKRFRQGMRTDPYLQDWDRVSAALGAAVYDPETDKNAEDVLMRADKRMYENKKQMKAGR